MHIIKTIKENESRFIFVDWNRPYVNKLINPVGIVLRHYIPG